MANIQKQSEYRLPTIEELTTDIEAFKKADEVNFFMSQDPPASWVKKHPFIKNHFYLPIDKVEFMLKKVFGKYQIEITGQGTAFNGVWVTVRVHYKDLATGEMLYHDGIGASELQTKSGESVANLNAINPGAIAMAFPIAKTLAVKDACDHFGRVFGADLNRKDIAPVKAPDTLKHDHEQERISKKISECKTDEDLEKIRPYITEKYLPEFKEKMKEINLKTKK